MSTENNNQVIARTYIQRNGQTCLELVGPVKRGQKTCYQIATNGEVEDARRVLDAEEAREFYDDAAYQIGERP